MTDEEEVGGPPRCAFPMPGDAGELEHEEDILRLERTLRANNAGDDDDSSSSSVESDRDDSLDGDDEERGGTHAIVEGGCADSYDFFSGEGESVLFPTFDSKGKFASYETSGGGPDDDMSMPHPNKRYKRVWRWYASMLAVVLLSVTAVSAVYLVGGNGDRGTVTTTEFVGQVAAAEKSHDSKHHHNHPKKDNENSSSTTTEFVGQESPQVGAAEQSQSKHHQNHPKHTHPKPEFVDQESQISAADAEQSHSSKHHQNHPNHNHPKKDEDDGTTAPEFVDQESQTIVVSEHAHGHHDQAHNHTHPKKDHAPMNPESVSSASSQSPPSPPSIISMTAVAVVTWSKSRPDELCAFDDLGVERDERISFVRFDLSSVISPSGGSDDVVVSEAVLKLYLKPLIVDNDDQYEGDNDAAVTTVKVDALPHAGEWTDRSISWYRRPQSKASSYVNSFDVVQDEIPPPATDFAMVQQPRLYEVDVTSAIDVTGATTVTFKIHTETTGGDLWFASNKWGGGEAQPALEITLAM